MSCSIHSCGAALLDSMHLLLLILIILIIPGLMRLETLFQLSKDLITSKLMIYFSYS